MSNKPGSYEYQHPKCYTCKKQQSAENLVSITGQRYCLECAGRVLPGGMLTIWEKKL